MERDEGIEFFVQATGASRSVAERLIAAFNGDVEVRAPSLAFY